MQLQQTPIRRRKRENAKGVIVFRPVITLTHKFLSAAEVLGGPLQSHSISTEMRQCEMEGLQSLKGSWNLVNITHRSSCDTRDGELALNCYEHNLTFERTTAQNFGFKPYSAMPFFPSTSSFSDCPNCGQTTRAGITSDYNDLNSAYEAHYHDIFPSNHSLPDDESLKLLLSRRSFPWTPRLGGVNSRITAVASLLEDLQRHQIEIQRAITLRKGLVSPIRKLPNEILANIFMEVHQFGPSANDDESSPMWSPFDMETIPWVAGQVCGRWRQTVCESCPALWSTFGVKIGLSGSNSMIGPSDWYHDVVGLKSSGEQMSEQYLVDIVREYLRRSHNSVLNFVLALDEHDRTAKEIIAALVDQCERWRNVTLRGSYSRPTQLDQIKGRLPLLEAFHWENSRELLPLDDETFAVAPQLHRLTMPHPYQHSFPWSQLQYLEMDQATSSILQHCSNLVECDVKYDSDSSPAAPLVFHHLRTFHCPLSSFQRFTNSPALEELTFTAPSIIEPLASRPTTVTFTLPHQDEKMHIAVALLKSFSDVTTLELWCNFHGNGRGPSSLPVIEALRLSQHSVMPQLKHLRMYHTNHIPRWFEVFQSRLPDIQSLQIPGIHPRPLDVSEECLEELRKHGLQITWKLETSSDDLDSSDGLDQLEWVVLNL
ncbi:hypothetical protein C8J56DRAFT_1090058 [Mycena floridula]|nr:hypothetical protein C8J56DRAFT_1090058 [Mycena floridula]